MANANVINSIYNYYLTTYAPVSDSKFDTHKKSELRGVYNSIVKMNKDAPWYLIDKSQETKEYAVGLKENARAFHNTIASLGGVSEDELLDKKVAFSSDETLAVAKYIGEDNFGEGVQGFDIEVSKLATTQLNKGHFLKPDSISLEPDTYSFDININGLTYEFQYNVTKTDTNKSVQEKLSRLIANSGIGLKATVESDDTGNTALIIESAYTGSATKEHLFNITDDNTAKTKGSVKYFGLANIEREASNAKFLINGIERESQGNTFTVQKQFEITLLRESSSDLDKAVIDLKADVDSVAANIEELIGGYNAFIDTAGKYAENHPKSGRLVNEMSTLASLHEEELSTIGINLEEDGHITLDKNVLTAEASDGNLNNHLDALKKFAGSMLRKADQVSLNPMHYAERTVAAYKNPGHNYASPYVTSAYTGMMFNSYC